VTDLESRVAGLSFDDPQPFLALADALQILLGCVAS